MKRLISVLLLLAVLLSLCACGGEETSGAAGTEAQQTEAAGMSKDEMLAQSTEFNMIDINNETLGNLARATLEYCDKVMEVTGDVIAIEADHAEIGTYNCRMKVYLPLEELVKLESYQCITVVGKTAPEIESTKDEEGFSIDYYVMDNAYLVKEYFEVSGKLFGKNESYENAWNILVPATSSVAKLVYFSEEVDTSALNDRAEITISAKFIGGTYCDATIISVTE